jgi:ketosteroid isomerase-like protein
MKLLALIAIAASSFGQTNYEGNKKGGGVEHSVTQIEQELVKALIAGDASMFERYLADTYIFTAPDGMVSDKAQTITGIKSGDLKFQSSKLEDMKVQAYGDTAVATYGSTDQGSYKGKDISGHFRWTDVFVKRNGRWQIVVGHGTPVTSGKSTP